MKRRLLGALQFLKEAWFPLLLVCGFFVGIIFSPESPQVIEMKPGQCLMINRFRLTVVGPHAVWGEPNAVAIIHQIGDDPPDEQLLLEGEPVLWPRLIHFSNEGGVVRAVSSFPIPGAKLLPCN